MSDQKQGKPDVIKLMKTSTTTDKPLWIPGPYGSELKPGHRSFVKPPEEKEEDSDHEI